MVSVMGKTMWQSAAMMEGIAARDKMKIALIAWKIVSAI